MSFWVEVKKKKKKLFAFFRRISLRNSMDSDKALHTAKYTQAYVIDMQFTIHHLAM